MKNKSRARYRRPAENPRARSQIIVNRQRQVRVSVRRLAKFIALARKSLRLPDDAFTIALVGNSQMARWNRAYRGKNYPTDVLSFPADEPTSRRNRQRAPVRASPGYLGDIAIAPAVARRNARNFDRTLDAEISILALHGILHLMGYDHETDRGQMARRERRLHLKLGLA